MWTKLLKLRELFIKWKVGEDCYNRWKESFSKEVDIETFYQKWIEYSDAEPNSFYSTWFEVGAASEWDGPLYKPVVLQDEYGNIFTVPNETAEQHLDEISEGWLQSQNFQSPEK